jgi:integrase
MRSHQPDRKSNRGRRKLTKRLIDSLRPRERDYVVMDSEVIGFGVRVLPSGSRFFFAQYRLPNAGRSGRTRRYKIGDIGRLTVDNARAIAKRDVTGPVAAGHDPFYERKAHNQNQLTIAQLAGAFLEDRKLRMKHGTVHEYERLLRAHVFPAMGNRELRSVQRTDVRGLHSSLSKTPAVANNVLAILGAMFRYAEDTEVWAGRNPCARVPRYELKSRKRSLRREEYQALGTALLRAEREGLPVPEILRNGKRGLSAKRRAKMTGRKRGPYRRNALRPATSPANPVAVAALRFLALSGWREKEVLGLRWDAVDFDRGVAILVDSKTGRSIRPLGAAALKVLRMQSRSDDNEHVFPGARSGASLQDAKRLWLAAKDAADLSCRLHDLRHSFCTVGRELGYADYIIARLVGHTVQGMTARYGDVPDETVALAADNIAGNIARRLDGDHPTVLPFPEPVSRPA